MFSPLFIIVPEFASGSVLEVFSLMTVSFVDNVSYNAVNDREFFLDHFLYKWDHVLVNILFLTFEGLIDVQP